MLLTTSRSRHNAAPSSPNGGKVMMEPPSTTGSPAGSTSNGQQQQQQQHDNKYSKSPNKSMMSIGGSGDRSSCATRLQFWTWIVCGIICSFLSIDYSMRTFFPSFTTANNNNSGSGSSTTNADAESILTPLQSSLALGNSDSSRSNNNNNGDGYRFDNLAFSQADPQHHAILIPYRDRSFHLGLFLEYMGPYLHTHFPHAHFTLWVVEQDDQELFNRAWLANVGLREIVKQAPETSCVIFHDVDLVPNMTSHVPYTTCQYPTQLGSELQHFNWSIPYPAYCGGITSLSLRHWQLINGLGNDFIGWGGEDDDLYHRLRQNGLLWQNPSDKNAAPVPRRPPKGKGVFRTISQKAEHHEQKKTHNQYWKTLELLKEMHENSDRWKFDGMSDVYYTITATKEMEPELGFAKYNHIKAIPQKTRDGTVRYHEHVDGTKGDVIAPLEFVHVPYTGGQAITKAAAQANIVWGACHYGRFEEWNCPPGISGDHQFAPMQFRASYHQAQKPWQIPLMRFFENPMEGTKRFTVVRHPYSRAISFYRFTYDAQHGYPYGFKYHDIVQDKSHPPQVVADYLREREHPEKLNTFLQDFLIRVHHPHQPDGFELEPQVNFVYHRGVKYVHHVLHYEFLQRDFKNILEKYEMTDVIELPPPDRKRKRKKQVVKKYDEKRVPKVAWMTGKLLFQPLWKFLGMADEKPPVVDMSLAEIEDEYLLGAQDLADETIAMLNAHYELDFRKFHYAKIKVNATTDAYWNSIQVIPRESVTAKQQNDRNAMLNKQKGQTGASPPPPAQGEAPKQTLSPKRVDEVAQLIRNKDGTAAPEDSDKAEQEESDTAKDGENDKSTEMFDKSDPHFQDRKKRVDERMKARDAERAHDLEANGSRKGGEKSSKANKALMNMRQIAETLRTKDTAK